MTTYPNTRRATPQATLPPSGKTTKNPTRRRHRTGRAPWWLLIPALAFYIFVVVVPSVRGTGYSFTDWDGAKPITNFVGLDNYRQILTDQAAAASLANTALYAIAITILQNAIGLALALGAHSKIKSRGILQVALFAPAVLTPIVTAYLWKFIFAPKGPLNDALGAVGLTGLQHDWLGDAATAPWTVILTVVWQFSGYSMVIFLAGLQGIPEEINEAASLDGAGAFRRFWSVTRPLLAPALTVNVMLSIVGNLKIFDQVQVLTGGGPGNATQSITTTIYREAFTYSNFSYGIALAVLLTVGIAVVSGVQYRYLARQENR